MSEQNGNPEHNDATPDEAHLGIAGNLARTFIHSPLTPLLLMVSVGLGLIGLLLTPRQEDPQISVPMVDIFVRYPGGSAEEVSNLIARPLERLMAEITGVKHVYSVAMREQAMVTVQFKVGENMEDSLVKLYNKLESNKDKIPPGASMPLVKPKGVDDVPIVTLTFWSNEVDDATLKLIALEVQQELNEIADTSQSFIVSGREEQLNVRISPEKLAGYHLGVGQVVQAIKAANGKMGVGQVEGDDKVYPVYTGSFLKTVEDVERLVIGTRNNKPIYIRDVAEVTLGPGETHRMVRYYTGAAVEKSSAAAEEDADDDEALPRMDRVDGAPAVTLAIAKKKGSNGVTVANDVLAKVDYLKGRVIPDNVHVAVTRNYGKTANDKVNELIFKLFVATGAVTLLVWYALGWRAAAVVLIVIPIVILFTVFSALILGYTIDRVSLFALIFSIGILVDDAIVVVENIYRRWLLKEDIDTPTSVDAVREVGNPTILATFTVIAALMPMGFVRGMMGPYMEPIPALGSVAMLFSLFAAFIFTPWLAMRFAPSLGKLREAADKEHREAARLENFFRRLINPLVDDRKKGMTFLIGLVVLFFLCCFMFYTKSVRVKMLPLDNKPEFNVVINFPEGTALPVTANFADQAVQAIRDIPEITYLQTYAGTASPFNFNGLVRHYYLRKQPWQADIQVQLLDKHERDRTSHEIAVEVRERLKPLAKKAGAVVQVVEMPPGPPVLQSVVAEIHGPDAYTRRKFAEDMTRFFEQAPSLDDVDNYLEADYEVWHFEVDREKAQRLGVTVEDINNALAMTMGEFKVGDIKYHALLEPTFIVLYIPLEERSELSRLGQLPVTNAQTGKSVPLAEVGRFVRQIQDKPIYHKDLRAVEYVTAETVGKYAAPIYGMLEVQDLLEGYVAPDGVTPKSYWIGPPPTDYESGFEWGGEWTVTYETFRDMGMAFGVALILIYMLVVWEFGNFTLPAIVMAPIPLTLIGIIPGHMLLNAEFTATSMIGFIALAGIIVRNSILLVDFAKHEVQAGAPVREAVIQACKARTRPILITAFALLLGSSVILFDPIFQGMAISLMFGGTVSTLLTLLVIPLGCISGRKGFCPPDPEGEPMGSCPIDPPGGGSGGGAGQSGGGSTSLSERMAFVKGLLAMMFAMAMSLLYTGWQKLKARQQARRARKEEARARSSSVATAPLPGVASAPQPLQTPAAPASGEASASQSREEHRAEPEAKPKAEPKAEPKAATGTSSRKKVAGAGSARKKSAARKKTGSAGKSEASRPTEAAKAVASAPVIKKKATPKAGKKRRGIRLKDDLA